MIDQAIDRNNSGSVMGMPQTKAADGGAGISDAALMSASMQSVNHAPGADNGPLPGAGLGGVMQLLNNNLASAASVNNNPLEGVDLQTLQRLIMGSRPGLVGNAIRDTTVPIGGVDPTIGGNGIPLSSVMANLISDPTKIKAQLDQMTNPQVISASASPVEPKASKENLNGSTLEMDKNTNADQVVSVLPGLVKTEEPQDAIRKVSEVSSTMAPTPPGSTTNNSQGANTLNTQAVAPAETIENKSRTEGGLNSTQPYTMQAAQNIIHQPNANAGNAAPPSMNANGANSNKTAQTENYRDFSTVGTDGTDFSSTQQPGKEPPFPVKLHRILSNSEYNDVICWLPHGRSWRVLKPKAFEENVIPVYFRHAKYASFMRQVSLFKYISNVKYRYCLELGLTCIH